MTTWSRTFIPTVFITLLVSLVPVAARPQEQKTAPDQQGYSPEGQPPEQAPAAVPEQVKPSSDQDDRQPGTLSIPQQEKPSPEAAVSKTETKNDESTNYTIKQGDTLWDISNNFLKDPFLWPLIWKANPYIANPDLIYPGNNLVIPSLAPIERAMAAPQEGKEQLVQQPTTTTPPLPTKVPPKAEEETPAVTGRLILPEQAPVPIIDKFSMLNAGFVSQDESRDKIVGSKEGKTIFAYDDIVYVTIRSKEDAAIGDKFIIYMPLENVRHPVTGKNFGRLIKVLGVLQLTEKGAPGVYAGRITISFDAAQKGSMLTPYQEPALIYDNVTQGKAKDISGYILEVVDTRTINAQTDIVYLDKGSAEGVEPGDRFVVYAEPQKRIYPKPMIGEAQVFLVKEHTSTAVVRKSSNTLAKGNQVEYKK